MDIAPTLQTVSDRIDFVIQACQYPSQTAFADALGVKSSQVITNWRSRNSIGRASAKLRAVTGVSTDWIANGVGEPFPSGPILYSGPRQLDPEAVRKLEADLHQLTLGLLAVIDLIGAKTPAEAQGLLDRLSAARKQREALGEGPALLRTLEVAAERSATARKHRSPRKAD